MQKSFSPQRMYTNGLLRSPNRALAKTVSQEPILRPSRLLYLPFPGSWKLSTEWRSYSHWRTRLKLGLPRGKAEWTASRRASFPRHSAASLCQRNTNLPKPRDGLLSRRKNFSKEFGKMETAVSTAKKQREPFLTRRFDLALQFASG